MKGEQWRDGCVELGECVCVALQLISSARHTCKPLISWSSIHRPITICFIVSFVHTMSTSVVVHHRYFFPSHPFTTHASPPQ
jgi:hypothetical protein